MTDKSQKEKLLDSMKDFLQNEQKAWERDSEQVWLVVSPKFLKRYSAMFQELQISSRPHEPCSNIFNPRLNPPTYAEGVGELAGSATAYGAPFEALEEGYWRRIPSIQPVINAAVKRCSGLLAKIGPTSYHRWDSWWCKHPALSKGLRQWAGVWCRFTTID